MKGWSGRGEASVRKRVTEMPRNVSAWGGEVGSALEKWLALSGACGGKG